MANLQYFFIAVHFFSKIGPFANARRIRAFRQGTDVLGRNRRLSAPDAQMGLSKSRCQKLRFVFPPGVAVLSVHSGLVTKKNKFLLKYANSGCHAFGKIREETSGAFQKKTAPMLNRC